MSKNLIARIAVAAVAIPAILWVCYQGGIWLGGMVVLFALIAMFEFLWNEGYRPRDFLFWLALLVTLIFVSTTREFPLVSKPDLYYFMTDKYMYLIMLFLISGMIIATGKETPEKLFIKHTRFTWGILYIILLYPFIHIIPREYAFLLEHAKGADLLLFLFGVLWVGDSAAMFGGKAFGKHKLAPTVSPNKTVEGFLCGIAGALVIGYIMYIWKLAEIGLWHMLILALGCSIFGQLGDLVESMWKRSLNIKDSSALIPGHGGILDRFDSLLFAAPFMYYYILYFVV